MPYHESLSSWGRLGTTGPGPVSPFLEGAWLLAAMCEISLSPVLRRTRNYARFNLAFSSGTAVLLLRCCCRCCHSRNVQDHLTISLRIHSRPWHSPQSCTSHRRCLQRKIILQCRGFMRTPATVLAGYIGSTHHQSGSRHLLLECRYGAQRGTTEVGPRPT